MLYASLTGPLIGVYIPLPYDDEGENRALLNKSKLAKLWCSVYTEDQVDGMIEEHGGVKLPARWSLNL